MAFWIPLAVGGTLAAGGMVGAARQLRKGAAPTVQDPDPDKLALGRFNELSDPQSDTYRHIGDLVRRTALDATPGLDQMASFSRMQGGSPHLGVQQAMSMVPGAREQATQQMAGVHMQGQQLASASLGQHLENTRMMSQMIFGRDQEMARRKMSFYDQMITLGGSMAMYGLNQPGKMASTQSTQQLGGVNQTGKVPFGNYSPLNDPFQIQKRLQSGFNPNF